MFSKTIFKQTLQSNYILWFIFTAVMALLSGVIIAVFDPQLIASMMEMVRDMPGMADMMGDRMDNMTSLLGMLGESFYRMQGILLALIFVIMTANSLVASQVDSGSMAYILSTPIKRAKVVRTRALYLITSIFCMFLVITAIGLFSVQLFHNGLWGTQYTADVMAAADILNQDHAVTANDLTLILNNEEALKAGAIARDVELEVYTVYLNLKRTNQAYEAAAEIVGVGVDELRKNLALIKENERALEAAARVMGMEPVLYSGVLAQIIQQSAAATGQAATDMQNKLMAGITAAARELDMEAADLATEMGKIKENPVAMTAALEASGLPEAMFLNVINQQLASDMVTLDKGIEFEVKDYLLLNLGAFLLMLAIGGISFLFSCLCNLSKNSLALGAGIPVAFFIFQIMAETSASLERFKYLSLNTLFAPNEITGGGTFWPQFAALAVLGTALYLIGIKVFMEKDLPL